MKIEIISTGEELLSGAVTDTNSAYMAQAFEENSYTVTRHTTVGDDFRTLVDLFRECGRRSDVTIVTGGLGPTTDDRSAEAAAEASGCSLLENEDALASVKAYFDAFGRDMSESDIKQTIIPDTSTCIANPVGTAPGFSLKIESAHFFFIPGVPWEMKEMLSNSVIPAVDALSGLNKSKMIKQSLFLFGLPEAVVSERLKEITSLYPDIIVGFRADFPVIEIKLSIRMAEAKDSTLDDTIFNNALDWVNEQIGDYIFSDSTGKIEAVIGNMLSTMGKTVSAAESCTGGLIGHKMTAVSGSSDYFLTSCVTYSNQSKIDILGVNPKTIDTFGAVSKETVKEMAEGVRRIAASDYSVATSGIAGPSGGSDDKPVGTVFIGIASNEETQVFEFKSPFQNRSHNKIIFYIKTLDMLRRILLEKRL